MSPFTSITIQAAPEEQIMTTHLQKNHHPLIYVTFGAAGGIILTIAWKMVGKVVRDALRRHSLLLHKAETDYTIGHKLVWDNIGGSLNAAMLYIGDKLDLYNALRESCKVPGSSTTAVALAKQTGLNQRWLREWLAQQASMGVLILLPGTGDDDSSLRYRLPKATADVFANPDSKEYDIPLIMVVPSLVDRAKTMLPEAFRTGIGRSYDDVEVTESIDRAHKKHIRDVLFPEVIKKRAPGVEVTLREGCNVADLGCGAAGLMIAMSKAFPNSKFHGYEISKPALERGAYYIASERVKNVFLHDATEEGESLGDQIETYDIIMTYDVLHDCTNPADLISQAKRALKPGGVWILGDIPAAPSIRDNLKDNVGSAANYGFSTCFCMSCGLSEEGGAGLGTLGFSVPVAKKLLAEGGFHTIEVLIEKDGVRWFYVK